MNSVSLGVKSDTLVWLLENGLSHDYDFSSNDTLHGRQVFIAYALDSAPNSAVPISSYFTTSTGHFSFLAGRVDVTYIVEIRKDLTNWTTDGVILTEPNENRMRTASLNLEDGRCFVRFRFVQDS